ncbi:ATP-dependent DNA helicase RecG [Halofilum ochraceum]|uniref:ATP-dependent DNA helicase RecG n=1 Tax=Halofilum ochraceum TaxID=1611323 RepID=UPI0008DA95C5|nr:ATP-dependent DNA helicase RecG [Halofilum ochraceum]
MAEAATSPAETTPVTALPGVGERLAERLARLGLATVADVLFHLPLRYQDRTRVRRIGELRPGDEAVVDATVEHASIVHGRRRALVARVHDGTGGLTLRWFHFADRQRKQLVHGARIALYGEVRHGPAGLEIAHPEYRLLGPDAAPAVENALTPVYPATEGVGQATLRRVTTAALERLGRGVALADPLVDFAPDGLPPLHTALVTVHRPPPDVDTAALLAGSHPACRRLAFEELLAHHLSLLRLRQRARARSAPSLVGDGELSGALRGALPFALTGAQERVVREVDADLQQPYPMLRLVQGDVGSGKTVVAALAALQCIEAGYQAAVMAPTEVLAEQHYRSFAAWLEPLGIRVGWLTGRLAAGARRRESEAIASGETGVAIGTHALFQEEVAFARLGLAVIDEQHRFGVHQRLALREKGQAGGVVPHQLIMTATPIPRTLAMTAYADLDSSVIDELPPGRQPVETIAVSSARRDEVVARVGTACSQGHQAYWVCTLIEVSEAQAGQAAAETEAALAEALPELRVGLVHGRLKAADKEAVMGAFQRGEIDLLVATTVIEVGVDVPNASLMVIENSERLGLSQLHQLRGRVGRGAEASLCVLLYDGPLSETARARLGTLRETSDGFRIAEKDLELRGPGEVLGTRQTGAVGFRIAEPMRDAGLLPRVRECAESVLAADTAAVDLLIARWLADGERYGDA